MDYRTRIRDWPEDDRPREKLIKRGPDGLSDAELLAIILRVGSHSMTAIDLARHILQSCNGFRGIDRLPVERLTGLHGVGPAKAAQIKAALAIGKRLAGQASVVQDKINKSRDVYDLYHLKYRDLPRERFSVLMLTSRNRIIDEKILFEGSLTECLVSPREVIQEIIKSGAAQVIFMHNHPSGEVSPSAQDVELTRSLQQACQSIDVAVLDHIIFGDNTYYSFADAGKL